MTRSDKHKLNVRNKIKDYLDSKTEEKTLSGLVKYFSSRRMGVVSREDLANFARKCFPHSGINYAK